MKQVSYSGMPTIGALELKISYQRNLIAGLTLAVLLHLGLAGSILVSKALQAPETITIIKKEVRPIDLTPPPTITDVPRPELKLTLPTTPVEIGRPAPVPDALNTELPIFPTQKDLGDISKSKVGEGAGDTVIPVPEGVIPTPEEFIPVEVLPEPITKVTPHYPELARKAGVTGTVYLRVLVDKTGKVRDVLIWKAAKADVGFEESAVEAVKQWVFSPAIQNGQPIMVWATIVMKFELH
jgi:protein TonB